MEQDVVAADVRRLRVKPHVAAMVSDFTIGSAFGDEMPFLLPS